MSRISEKVRDIVQIRPYTTVLNFARDPEKTLSYYHFTDITAEMMVRWVDAVVDSNSSEGRRAVAGFRGVGKSHFLAAFSIILAHPELRSRIAEPHVLNACQRLMRRHYPVVNVRRGVRDTLLQEFCDAVSEAFSIGPATTGGSIRELVEIISSQSSGVTPILLFDSAAERSGPVNRDDGEILAEIAAECSGRGIFVGLALDDDIAGADGLNSAVSASYSIDYLDQEHLFKVVNTHIFPKNPRMQTTLEGLYTHFRATLPAFNWSEQRFMSLYPLHPATLELAPFIRSYLPDFALLGFASAAAEKILGRPADSLIGLEEVFDVAEPDLRKVKELESTFEIYDRAVEKVVLQLPVSSRHKAKLVLKALLLLSLAQLGSTASQLAAAMMIPEDESYERSQGDISAMLAGFHTSLPESITVEGPEGEIPRYLLGVGSSEFLKRVNELADDARSAVRKVLEKGIMERFPDIDPGVFGSDGVANFYTHWRGSIRPGRLITRSFVESECSNSSKRILDIVLDFDGGNSSKNDIVRSPYIEWKPAELRADERSTLAMNAALAANPELHSEFPDQYSSAQLNTATAVRGIVERVMIADAQLAIDGFDYNFPESARSAVELNGLFSSMLEPLFEALYPEHPYFGSPFTQEIVDRAVAGIFANENVPGEYDEIAASYGDPLGICELGSGGYSVVSKESLQQLPMVAAVNELLSGPAVGLVEIEQIEEKLGDSPFGFTRESIRLVLSAMAFRDLVEFRTKDNDRVGGRSIDLKLDWNVIAGISRCETCQISPEKVLEWARLITGQESISSLDAPEDRARILEAFVEIATQWERRGSANAFEKVPDCEFSTAIWRDSSRPWDNYSAMVAKINDALIGGVTLEESLERIGSNFLEEPEAFHVSRESVTRVEDFAQLIPEKDRISTYMTLSELTCQPAVELAREKLRISLCTASDNPTEQKNRELGYAWEKFMRLYSEYYLSVHDSVQNQDDLHAFYVRRIGEDDWNLICSVEAGDENSAELRGMLRSIKRKLRSLTCDLDPAPYLAAVPYCSCGFLPSESDALEELLGDLRQFVLRLSAGDRLSNYAITTARADRDVLDSGLI